MREASALFPASELVTVPFPERERPEITGWDRACEALLRSVRRPFVRRGLKAAQILTLVETHADVFGKADEAGLRAEADRLRHGLLVQGFTPEAVARAFALVREVSDRRLGLRHRYVQLTGGLAMLRGSIAEMRTGEGKTITALLPAATAALAGIPVHVVTVNDYLAERDAEQAATVLGPLGLSVGLALHGQSEAERRAAYGCDVLYASNKELVFDYLKDLIALGKPSSSRFRAANLHPRSGAARPLMRGLSFAIVDEADSIFIDEARTPLIISRDHPADLDARLCGAALAAARLLVAGEDYAIDHRARSVALRSRGQLRIGGMLGTLEGFWKAKRAREELAEQALAALHLYGRDQHYIVVDDRVQIVDEFTGRTMPDRQWQRGLQQLIEVKEGCPPTGRRETMAQITYQRFFRRYLCLCGMTGTGAEVWRELDAVYGLSVVPIPTHRPDRKVDRGLTLCGPQDAKWDAVLAATRTAVGQGRPVLIGTRSVEASEQLSRVFAAAALPHVVLNARNEPEEADLVAAAGGSGRVTIATNMAGRGTDIKLGPEVAARGGLHVILTEFHQSGRIDRQLYGRCGRQGDPGSHEAIVSLDDLLLRHFSGLAGRAARLWGRGRRRLPAWLGRWLRVSAQRQAERQNARVRANAVRRDRDMDRSLAFARKAN